MQRLWIVLGLITATCFFAGGYWLGDRKSVKEVVKFQDRVVIQESQKRDESVTKTQIVTVKPDGTKTTRTQVTKAVKASSTSQTEREKTQETVKVPQANSKNGSTYRLSIYLPPRWPVTTYKDIRVEVTHRLVGPLVVGAQVSLAGEVLVGLGVDF